MPFTLSHSIAGIALHRVSLQKPSLSALIIGAMMPDAEYLLRMKMLGIFGHTFLGIWLFDLPLGLLFFILFQKVIKTPLILNLPQGLSQRFTPFLANPPTLKTSLLPIELQSIKGVMLVLLSLFLGILSHICWDDFTHQTGFFVTRIALLQQEATLFHTKLPFYKILQLTSSLLGAIAIALWIYFLPKQKVRLFNQAKWRYQALFMALIIFIMMIRLSVSFTLQYANLMVITLAASFLSLFLTALIWQFKNSDASFKIINPQPKNPS